MNAGYLVERSARYFPERTAFVIDGTAVTYRHLNRRINKLANALLSLGLKKGDRVGLLFHNSYAYLESFLALYKAGLVWVRLNARLAPQELKGMLEDSGAVVLMHGPQFGETAEAISEGLQWTIHEGDGPGIVYEEFLEKGADHEPEANVTLEDLSDLWYTSGTTGAPKGIMLTHRNIMTCTQLLLSDVYDITTEDKFLTAGALSHAGSVRVLPFIIRGAACYLHSHFDPDRMLSETREQGITDWAVVPTMLVAIMDHPKFEEFDLGAMKRITYAGSPLPVERIKEGLEKFGPILDQSYGQAESIITITHLPRQDHVTNGDPIREKRLASAGREYPGVRVRVVNEADEAIGPGEVGEVVTRSDLVMRGYWNQPEKTEEAMKGGWLHTGDIGYMDEGGYLFLVDRKHDKIITGGLNVFPREVEEVLATHEAVAQVAVFGVKDPYWGEAVTAAIVLKRGKRATEDDIKAFCKENLAGYKRPKKILFMDDLPKNLYGKVMRKELKKQLEGA
ncbi:MAG: AMP-binding protein [Deltaproteobacteria bacterium]|nr:AMP-binding protein [Deltaproteobacteria bacterium]MBW2137222.1 AMP-binding protein [Deltaproteobacteria bacterium]